MKKRSLIDADNINKPKKSKHADDLKNMYGDGVVWFRGDMIGKGSYGCVFIGSLKNPNSKYSSYPPIMAVKSAEVSASCSIQKEKEVMDNIRGNPNVIECYGEEITNGDNGQMVYNLLLEYGSGGTLDDLIKKSDGKGLSEFDVRRYARSIVLGLSHVHKKGYVHCDLKPQNVMMVSSCSKNGGFNAKIGDFGLAKRAKQRNNSGTFWRGTPLYLAPEVVSDGVQEPPADIWAVGCIVLEMLTGKSLGYFGQDLCVDEILSRVDVSKEGISFLKGCLCKKVMCRLTANMLLNHPFLKGLVDNDDVNEVIESRHDVFDINAITSSPEFYDDNDDDDDDDCDGYSDDDDELWASSSNINDFQGNLARQMVRI